MAVDYNELQIDQHQVNCQVSIGLRTQAIQPATIVTLKYKQQFAQGKCN